MSKTVARLLTACAAAATVWQKPLRRCQTLLFLSNYLHRHHTIETAAGPISFVVTHPQALDYAFNLLTREPDTIEWLDLMLPGDVLWDIGANVGAYALYGARRGVQVWAFEPAAASFAALVENIRINGLEDRITALPIALGNSTGLGRLVMSSTFPGSVGHNLGGVDTDRTVSRQSVLNFTVDDFCRIYGMPRPTHIKLDVDGIEIDILEGARGVLADPKLRSILIEVDVSDELYYRRICDIAALAGLRPARNLRENVIFERVAG